jgi:acetylornithine deacetylase/succinyl-diaminopimelate desuccinylase-like protein
MGKDSKRTLTREQIVELLGGPQSFEFYEKLVELDTTNYEDPKTGIVEKRNHEEATRYVADYAKSLGLPATIYDPTKDPDLKAEDFKGAARPNVVIDYEVGARETLLLLAHYDTVPVPSHQAKKWSYPPHKLTIKNGRIYGRGSNDDKGSGVWASMQALKELKAQNIRNVNIRLFICCDEETGSTGGLLAIMKKDKALEKRGEKPMLYGHLAMLPDASPTVIAGSSGVVFSDVIASTPCAPSAFFGLAERIAAFHEVRSAKRSLLDAEDSEKEGEKKVPGRLTVTKLDWTSKAEGPFTFLSIHAETDSHNTIAEVVTVEYSATKEGLDAAKAAIKDTGLASKVKWLDEEKHDDRRHGYFEVVGQGGHGGYPHRFDNPVNHALPILKAIAALPGTPEGTGSLGVDMRLVPEEDLTGGIKEYQEHFESAKAATLPGAKLLMPADRQRPGYFIPVTQPDVQMLKRAFDAVTGEPTRIIGEYGGTDASFFTPLKTPLGKPLVALMFGSMDHESNIHSIDENAKPELLRQNVDLLLWIAKNWQNHE